VKFKRQRRYNLFQNRSSRKRPFRYTEESIHKRLWIQHFRENIELIVKVVGTLFIALVLLNFVHHFVVLIGIAISIHVYTTFMASLFVDRFQSGIVQVLPWDVGGYQKTVKQWGFYGAIPLLIPTIIFAIIHFHWWGPIFILLVIITAVFNYTIKMGNAAAILEKKLGALKVKDVLSFLMLGFIVLCEYHPSFALISMGILLVVIYRSRRKHKL
jgi:hypothetical protein